MQAALHGAAEIGFTVLSISISLVAVFIPILLMGGIVGRLFREFAITLSVAIAISLLISLTTTPMMCALLLRSQEKEKHGRRLPPQRMGLQQNPARLRALAAVGVATSAHHAAGHARHHRPHRLPLHRRAQGILPAAGHRPIDPGRFWPINLRPFRPCADACFSSSTS